MFDIIPASRTRRYFLIACHVLWREFCYYASQSKNSFNFNFLDQGLHCTPDLLRAKLQEVIDEIKPVRNYEAILIGYGLCSNGLMGITARDIPLIVMRAHDCVTFLLGSRERYRTYFDEHPGAYWYSPGWIDTSLMPGKERYGAMLKYYIETYGEENAEYLMRSTEDWISNYSRATYVDLGFYDTQWQKEFTRQCAKELGWEYDELDGDSRLVRDFLEGNWDSDNFLVVPPGHTVVPSHDEWVIEAKVMDGNMVVE